MAHTYINTTCAAAAVLFHDLPHYLAERQELASVMGHHQSWKLGCCTLRAECW